MTKPDRLPEGLTPVALNLDESSAYCGTSHHTFSKMIAEGLMPKPRVFGARRFWLQDELKDALRRLPVADAAAAAREAEGSDLDRLLGT